MEAFFFKRHALESISFIDFFEIDCTKSYSFYTFKQFTSTHSRCFQKNICQHIFKILSRYLIGIFALLIYILFKFLVLF